MCPLYVAGLIGPGERKSIEPMAARLAPDRYDRLHHFISDGVWETAPLEAELARRADKLAVSSDAFLVVDDTSLPKEGRTLGRRRSAICVHARQASQLPDVGFPDVGAP
jgi:SRSO17 transposase